MDINKAYEIFDFISNNDKNFILAGSARRGKENDLKDIDVIYIGDKVPDFKYDKIVANGSSFRRYIILGEKVDLHITDKYRSGSMLLYFTGSAQFNIKLRRKAKSLGLTLNRYGLFTANEKCVKYKNHFVSEREEYIFNYLNEIYVEPKNRSILPSSDDELTQDIINKLNRISLYLSIQNESRRAGAYSKAAISLSYYENIMDIARIGNLRSINGIGKSIESTIHEYIQTGKINKLEDLKNQCPIEIDSLLSIDGIGPSTIRKLYNELNIQNIPDLRSACEKDLLIHIHGLGVKTQQNILEQI